MKQNYIEWLYPGVICSESISEKVDERILPLEYPKHAFGFRFYDRTEVKTEDGENLYGKADHYTDWYYLGAALSFEEIKQKYPSEKILIDNMRINKYDRVVKTIHGQFMPLKKNDVVLTK